MLASIRPPPSPHEIYSVISFIIQNQKKMDLFPSSLLTRILSSSINFFTLKCKIIVNGLRILFFADQQLKKKL